MKCVLCNVPLEMKRITFIYLGHEMYHQVPCCPVCGQVYISEELAQGKMYEVETQLEDK